MINTAQDLYNYLNEHWQLPKLHEKTPRAGSFEEAFPELAEDTIEDQEMCTKSPVQESSEEQEMGTESPVQESSEKQGQDKIPPVHETSMEQKNDRARCKAPHTVRKFFFVTNIDRTIDDRKTKTYVGTHKLHSVRSTGAEGIIEIRKRSCCCGYCIGYKPELRKCENEDNVKDWQTIDIKVSEEKGKACSQNLKPGTSKAKRRCQKQAFEKTESRKSSQNQIPQKFPTRQKNSTKKTSRGKKRAAEEEFDEPWSPKRPQKLSTQKESPVAGPSTRSKSAPVAYPARPSKQDQKPRNKSTKPNKMKIADILQNERIPQESWHEIGSILRKSSFVEKVEVCELLSIPPLLVAQNTLPEIMELEADEDAEELMQSVGFLPGSVKVPINILGDGNCGARCGSIMAFGSQQYHFELRFRMAMEMIQFQDLYLSDAYLARGWPEECTPVPTVVTYQQLCNRYFLPQQATEMDLTKNFNKEVDDLLEMGSFMGVFALFALASVIGCPLVSVYPAKGDPVAQHDLHRLILPRELIHQTPRFIMWSGGVSRDDRLWVANHFVVLVPFDGKESASLEECRKL